MLDSGADNRKRSVIKDFTNLARGTGPLRREALQMLQNLVKNRDYDLALRAYDNICGEEELEAVILCGRGSVWYLLESDRHPQ